MNGNRWKFGKGKRILPPIVVTALINAVGIWPINANAGEVIAKAHSFEVPVSSLNTEASPIYYRGLPLNADHPSMGYSDGQEAMATAKKFPGVVDCLSLEPEDETVSLAKLNTGKFEKTADLEICLQRVGSEFGDLAKVESWLRAIGFGWVEEQPISGWLGAGSLGMDSGNVAVFHARWRGERDKLPGRTFPMSARFNLSNSQVNEQGITARNLNLTLVIRRHDMRVISVDAVMIYL